MDTDPLLTFKSHVEGKNAEVAIFADRIEWAKEGWLGTSGKVALGVMTLGTSLLKTGVSGKSRGTEMIPVKSISSVTTEKDGLRFSKVKVITVGNTIDFRVSHGDASKAKDIISRLIVGTHPAQQADGTRSADATAPPVVDASATVSVADELKKLGDLRAAGLLSEEEFNAQKAKLLE